ncbi:MAG: FAD-linked oxidase [Sulfurimonas sp.]|nr:MAG: FAD-linked oxidase [Sulfurimonas sp.]
MNLMSWGMYPKIDNEAFPFTEKKALRNHLKEVDECIAYGNGRSYGDSALNRHLVTTRPHHCFLNFDEQRGILHVECGVLLREILDVIVPRGWFLKVTPGTKLITIGGAIASDVHGKNHHIEGCFSESVLEFTLMLPSGKIITCSHTKNKKYFYATCGGMGLTGIILDAKIVLKKIASTTIEQTIVKTANLQETFEAFEHHHEAAYSVAWIDCLAQGKHLGRSLLMCGDFSTTGSTHYQPKKHLNIPFTLPSFLLNPWSVKAFNRLYYNRVSQRISTQEVDMESFFYPLDAIENWNRIYGKAGFTQYQFVLPKDQSYDGLHAILHTIAASTKGSFLAVLKLYAKANKNYLSFPMEGYSLALDFKIEPGLFELLDTLDALVLKYGGRIYLSKDVRVSKAVFEQGYEQIERFRALRKEQKMNTKFNSLQSKRLEL